MIAQETLDEMRSLRRIISTDSSLINGNTSAIRMTKMQQRQLLNRKSELVNKPPSPLSKDTEREVLLQEKKRLATENSRR